MGGRTKEQLDKEGSDQYRCQKYQGFKRQFHALIPIHMISARASNNELVLGQLKVADKSNEITAIPLLLELLDIQCNIVTIDAIGAQLEISKKIGDKADYQGS